MFVRWILPAAMLAGAASAVAAAPTNAVRGSGWTTTTNAAVARSNLVVFSTNEVNELIAAATNSVPQALMNAGNSTASLINDSNSPTWKLKSLSADGATLTDQGTNIHFTISGGAGGGQPSSAILTNLSGLPSTNVIVFVSQLNNISNGVVTVSNGLATLSNSVPTQITAATNALGSAAYSNSVVFQPANIILTNLAGLSSTNQLVGQSQLFTSANNLTNYVNDLVTGVGRIFYASDATNSFTQTVITNAAGLTNFSLIDSVPISPTTNSIVVNGLANQYFFSRTSTNIISRITAGPSIIHTHIYISGGGSFTGRPELWLWFTNDSMLKIAEGADATYSSSAPEEIDPTITVTVSTNTPAGTRLVLRWYITSESGNPTVNFISGGAYDSRVTLNTVTANGVYAGVFIGDGASISNVNALTLLGLSTNAWATMDQFNDYTNRADLAFQRGNSILTNLAGLSSTNQLVGQSQLIAATNALGTAAYSNSVVFQPANDILTNLAGLSSTNQLVGQSQLTAAIDALGSAAYSNSTSFQPANIILTNLAGLSSTNQLVGQSQLTAATNALGTAAYSNSVVFQPANIILTNLAGLSSTNQLVGQSQLIAATNALGSAAYSNSTVFQAAALFLTDWSGLATNAIPRALTNAGNSSASLINDSNMPTMKLKSVSGSGLMTVTDQVTNIHFTALTSYYHGPFTNVTFVNTDATPGITVSNPAPAGTDPFNARLYPPKFFHVIDPEYSSPALKITIDDVYGIYMTWDGYIYPMTSTVGSPAQLGTASKPWKFVGDGSALYGLTNYQLASTNLTNWSELATNAIPRSITNAGDASSSLINDSNAPTFALKSLSSPDMIFTDQATNLHFTLSRQYAMLIKTNGTVFVISNTAAETALTSFMIPGGSITNHRTLRVTTSGVISNSTGAGRTFILRVRLGGTTLAGTIIYQDSSISLTTSTQPRAYILHVQLSDDGTGLSQNLTGHLDISGVAGSTIGYGDLGAVSIGPFPFASSSLAGHFPGFNMGTNVLFEITVTPSFATNNFAIWRYNERAILE